MFTEIFNIEKKNTIVITGAGGKTSLLFALAEELSQKGKVLVTTTTKIYKPEPEKYEKLIIKDSYFYGEGKNITVVASAEKDNKLVSLSYDEIEKIKKDYDYVLIEGDGAKEKLLKKWNDSEPCIPPFADKIIGIVNCDIFDMEISEKNIHRFHLLEKEFPQYINQKVNSSFLANYLKSADYFKGASDSAPKYLFFNGIDGEGEIDKFSFALDTVNKMTERDYSIIMGSIKKREAYPYQRVDAVVMASGFSKRMGSNKLKLEINGISLLEITLKKLAALPFNEILVCGREEWTERLGRKYNLKYFHNSLAHLGQSESIKLGVKNCKGEGIVFFTGDQPFLTKKTILTLYLNFLKRNLITIPIVSEKRFSPVFFPAEKKSDLLKLEGDTGGRIVIRNTPVINLINFASDKEFIDIDTEDEYMYVLKNNKGIIELEMSMDLN